MRKTHRLCDTPCIVNIASGTARPLLCEGCTVIIELHRQPNRVEALVRDHCSNDRTIHSSGHSDGHSRLRHGFGKAK